MKLIIEIFVILLYDKASHMHRYGQILAKTVYIENQCESHSTEAALEQHVKKAVYQGRYVWGLLLIANAVIPSSKSWGYMKTSDNLYVPNWTTLPEASKACYELVSWKCKKGCVKNCKCMKLALECTALCMYAGECLKMMCCAISLYVSSGLQ